MSKKHKIRKHINKGFIPNIFTVFNMFLGFTALILIVAGDPLRAAWFIFAAAILDAFDGKLARLIGIESSFGAEFDSFADTISFCATSSLLIYTTWVSGLSHLIAILLSFMPLLLGTIRLAKYNLQIDDNPKSFFIGLPVPTYALSLFGFLHYSNQTIGTDGDPRIGLVIAIGLGFMMISRIKFVKIPYISFRMGTKNTLRLIVALSLFIATIIWQGLVLFPIILLYILWNIVHWIIHPDWFEVEHELIEPSEGN